MAANSTGWFWTALARETGRIGHLYSPGAQRSPRPWWPYALDNGCYSLWDQDTFVFDFEGWRALEPEWHRLIFWAQAQNTKPLWAVVPDVPGDAAGTLERWGRFAPEVPFPRALAVQDGMTVEMVRALPLQPDVIAVGGSTTDRGRSGWKWDTLPTWVAAFPRVHVLRCNSPTRLYQLESMGVESCDGTGWNRGDRDQTKGLEEWARSKPRPMTTELWPYTCREPKNKKQRSLI